MIAREPNRLTGQFGTVGNNGTTRPFVPPEDPESEEALLGCILLAPAMNMPIAAKIVRLKDFTREAARLTYEAMLELWNNDIDIDFRTVESALRKPLSYGPGSQWLVGLMQNVPMVSNAQAYATRIRYCGTARDILIIANEMAHLGVTFDSISADWNPDTIISRAVGLLETLVEDRGGGKVLTSEDVAHEYASIMTARREKDPAATGYPLGFPELDKLMGWKPGELVFIAGATSSGKTAFMGTLAEALVDREPPVPTLYVSIEQPIPQLMDRIVANKMGINAMRLARGDITDDEQRLMEIWLEVLAQRRLTFVKEGSLTTAALDAHVQFAVARSGTKVVFVDYAQIMADMPEEDPVRRVGYISGQLRRIAKRHNVTIVAGSQVNAEDKLRWARELENDAFIILLLKRDKKDSMTRVHILKHRNGPAGIDVAIYFNPETAHFSPTPISTTEVPV